jgi:hypothetical protein
LTARRVDKGSAGLIGSVDGGARVQAAFAGRISNVRARGEIIGENAWWCLAEEWARLVVGDEDGTNLS